MYRHCLVAATLPQILLLGLFFFIKLTNSPPPCLNQSTTTPNVSVTPTAPTQPKKTTTQSVQTTAQPVQSTTTHRGERVRYSRSDLLKLRRQVHAAPKLINKLRVLGIGTNLPRKRRIHNNGLKVGVLNAQSCRQVANEINELIVDRKIDI